MTDYRALLVALLLPFATILTPGEDTVVRVVQAETSFDHSYAAWNGILHAHVRRDGMVDYKGLSSNAALKSFLDSVASVSAKHVAGWSRAQKLAFYCNAYNAYTFQTILDAWPVRSIRDIKPDAWDNARWKVAGQLMSLNDIEHKQLRGKMKEYRVHFVLVCAARSCPVLPDKAIVPEGVDSQLERYAQAFFTDTSRNRVDQAAGKVYLSKLMDWYGGDFNGAPATYMAKYVDEASRAFLEAGQFTVEFNEYDWSLNKQ
jgi:hypothetical protein